MLAQEGVAIKAQAVAGQRMSEDSPLKGIVELAAVQPAKLEAPAAPEVAQSGVRFLDISIACRHDACTRCSAHTVLILTMAFSSFMSAFSQDVTVLSTCNCVKQVAALSSAYYVQAAALQANTELEEQEFLIQVSSLGFARPNAVDLAISVAAAPVACATMQDPRLSTACMEQSGYGQCYNEHASG